MSKSMNIFIRATKSLDDIGREVAVLLGVPLQPSPLGDLRFQDADRLVFVHGNTYENDDVIDFESYQFCVGLSAPTSQRTEQLARQAFAVLKEKTTYPILLVEDIEKAVDQRP